MIRLITSDMLNQVLDIYQAAIERMEELHIHQWDAIYPNNAILQNDIKSGWMYGYFQEEELCAVQAINALQSPEYLQVAWHYIDTDPLVVHRLCVAPKHQNKGLAQAMVRFAEDLAVEKNFKTIRLDAFIDNPISVHLYTKMGYRKAGIVQFRKGAFYCFEKKTIHY